MTALQKTRFVKTSFILDIHSLELDIVQLHNTIQQPSLRYLRVICAQFDPTFSKFLQRVLKSVHWSTIESLTLHGDHIDGWIEFLVSMDAPRLTYLDIHGTRFSQQQLSHSSVLFVQRLLETSPLEELHLKNIELQDKRDWIRIVQSMDMSMLDIFELTKSSRSQFMATEAVDLYNSKVKSIEAESDDLDTDNSIFVDSDV
ncbi:hypothetical protein BG005_000438, partial [Podila minutissima]